MTQLIYWGDVETTDNLIFQSCKIWRVLDTFSTFISVIVCGEGGLKNLKGIFLSLWNMNTYFTLMISTPQLQFQFNTKYFTRYLEWNQTLVRETGSVLDLMRSSLPLRVYLLWRSKAKFDSYVYAWTSLRTWTSNSIVY